MKLQECERPAPGLLSGRWRSGPRGRAGVPAAVLLAVLALAVTLPAGCSKNDAGRRKLAVPVTVARVVVLPQPLSLKAVGTVEPLEAVSVRAQVGGVITEVRFSEGQEVRAGQTLFQIDPRPFRVALDAAEAQLARDSSQLANAQVQARRYSDLVQKDYVTQEQYDAAQTEVEVLRSTVQVDKAAVEQARLNLGYASVSAPISGRTGSLLVKRGNVVRANDAALVVINQMRPIRVSFAVPESQLSIVQRYAAGGKRLQAIVRPSKDSGASEQRGHLTFLDNAVDPSTGTVTLKAEFLNADASLLPGQFVDTELVLDVEADAITVPASAVVTGQEGSFVFVVAADKKAEKRPVKVNRTQNGTAVIDEGVRAGETVVTDGQMRLTPGAVVEIKQARSAR